MKPKKEYAQMRLYKETHARLAAIGTKSETFDQIINRLIDENVYCKIKKRK